MSRTEYRAIAKRDLRANQKERTREALVDAAKALVSEGAPPSVAEAAERARVSRATAYRYFPTQDSLLIEISDVTPVVEPVEQVLEQLQGDDPEARLTQLLDTCNPIMVAEEARLRTALRVYLDTWLEARKTGAAVPKLREGRRMRWLDIALAPVKKKLSRPEWRRLQAALALTLSIDALVVMKDVAHLDNEEALETLRWTALALLRYALVGKRR
jgi:AcrR family transcriptional regulator